MTKCIHCDATVLTPATPAVGGELADAIDSANLITLHHWNAQKGWNDETELTDKDQTLLAAALRAQPASPLRGRDDLIPAGKQAKFKHGKGGDWFGVYDWHNNPESFEYRTVYALYPSLPEQPR